MMALSNVFDGIGLSLSHPFEFFMSVMFGCLCSSSYFMCWMLQPAGCRQSVWFQSIIPVTPPEFLTG